MLRIFLLLEIGMMLCLNLFGQENPIKIEEFILDKNLFKLTPLEIENRINELLSSLVLRGYIIDKKKLNFQVWK